MKIASVSVLRNDIETEVNKFFEDAAKFIGKANKAAGRRSRVSTNKLTAMFREWRKLTVEDDNEE